MPCVVAKCQPRLAGLPTRIQVALPVTRGRSSPRQSGIYRTQALIDINGPRGAWPGTGFARLIHQSLTLGSPWLNTPICAISF